MKNCTREFKLLFKCVLLRVKPASVFFFRWLYGIPRGLLFLFLVLLWSTGRRYFSVIKCKLKVCPPGEKNEWITFVPRGVALRWCATLARRHSSSICDLVVRGPGCGIVSRIVPLVRMEREGLYVERYFVLYLSLSLALSLSFFHYFFAIYEGSICGSF